ncbi:hypothetical protein K474DRAFT_1675211 [Panus rudis PR-1116 ss-1]|nr:hypothetical protein K474DRAFT_1675211 [Panus rudis PR-1116 ss-1]
MSTVKKRDRGDCCSNCGRQFFCDEPMKIPPATPLHCVIDYCLSRIRFTLPGECAYRSKNRGKWPGIEGEPELVVAHDEHECARGADHTRAGWKRRAAVGRVARVRGDDGQSLWTPYKAPRKGSYLRREFVAISSFQTCFSSLYRIYRWNMKTKATSQEINVGVLEARSEARKPIATADDITSLNQVSGMA